MLRELPVLLVSLVMLVSACPKEAGPVTGDEGESTMSTSNGETVSPTVDTDINETAETVDTSTGPVEPDPDCSSSCVDINNCTPEADETDTAGLLAKEVASTGGEEGTSDPGTGTAGETAGDTGGETEGGECGPGLVCKNVGVCGCEEFMCVPA